MADRQNTVQSYAIVASPAGATETVVASCGPIGSLFAAQSFKIHGWVNITAEGSTTSVVLKVRRSSLTGTLVGTSPTYAGTDILAPLAASLDVYCADTPTDVGGQVYVLTATCAGAGGASTVNGVYLDCRVD